VREPVLLSWSGGKDSAMALHALRQSPDFVPAGLLTTLTEGYDRISIHGVRRELLERQADAADAANIAGLPLHPVWIPPDASNDVYEERMAAVLSGLRENGLRRVAFGDLFLEDIRAYRERLVGGLGLEAVFPVWGRDTAAFAREVIALGFAAVLVCVDTERLDPSFAGRAFDEALLADLPAGVDPCGENGEFHTFVHAGPVFSRPIAWTPGPLEVRGRFCWRDLLPAFPAPGAPSGTIT
jgi:uncharacterized protein (TIGR00290 family)